MPPFERIEALFHGALALPAGERRQWLEEQCGDVPETLHEVLELVESHEAIAHGEAGSTPAQPVVPTAQFGAYRAVELVGRGGMSAVYRAQRADGQFEQTVALKIMAGYLAGPEFLRRFESERRLLATLSHNHITRLLDGGVSSAGDPYLVTEFVEGQTIERYCDEKKLDIPARLRIFLQVCEAVEYAHRNLIIHRDLKPANILVDSSGSAKLLDFGTASLSAPDGATVTGIRMLTPRYASPEQLRGQRLDVASDVFSLGVVLYELVTGAWPFGDPASALSELSRAVGDAMVRPPTSVLTAEAAGNRSASLDALRQKLRGDLSAILQKALEEKPASRYESVSHFAADLRRCLENRPVQARPQTAWYRAAKFARRHRISLTAAALLVLFVAASSAFVYQVQVTRTQKKRQVAGLGQIVEQTGLMISDHIQKSQLDLARVEVQDLRDSLEQVRRDNPDDPAVWNMLGNSYLQLGMISWFRYGPSFMDAEMALDYYGRARALYEKSDSRHLFGAYQSAINTRVFQSEVLAEDGRALKGFREAVSLLLDDEERMAAPPERNYNSLANMASYYDMLSDRLGNNSAWEEIPTAPAWYADVKALRPYRITDSIAIQLYGEVLPRQPGEDEASFTQNSRAAVLLQLGRLQHQAGLREEGRRSLREALREFTANSQEAHLTGFTQDRMASVHVRLSRAAEVEGKFAEALGEREQALHYLEGQLALQPTSLYLKERVAASRIASAKLLELLGRHAEAMRDGQSGLQFLQENADRERAAALSLDTAAQRLLTIEPVQLRDTALALRFASRAVQQTASQMPAYLITLSVAQLAAGDQEAAQRTAALAVEGYRKVTEILQPLVANGRYPEAVRLFAEWRQQLGQMTELR